MRSVRGPPSGQRMHGRSRGGLSTKLHLAVDGRGVPMSVILTPAKTARTPDSATARTNPGATPRARTAPDKRPEAVLADTAYFRPPPKPRRPPSTAHSNTGLPQGPVAPARGMSTRCQPSSNSLPGVVVRHVIPYLSVT